MATKKMALNLTISEISLLCRVLGFIEAGEISGGPLEGLKHQQTTANLKVFRRLQDEATGAYAHFFAPPHSYYKDN